MHLCRPLAVLGLVSTLVFSISAQSRVAVLEFKNNGSASLAHLSGAIPDMLTTNFAGSSEISVVERSQIQKLLGEMALGQSGIIDPATAAQVGKMAGANMVVIGSYVDLGKKLRIDAKVVNVESGSIVPGATKSATATTLEDIDVAVDGLARDLLGKLTGDVSIQGDPDRKGRFELTTTDFGAYNVVVDGMPLQFAEGTAKAVLEVENGKHLVQVVKGMFKPETIWEGSIQVPGGYVVRARYAGGKIAVYETAPMAAPAKKSAEPAKSATTTTTVNAVVPDHAMQGMNIDVNMNGMNMGVGVGISTSAVGMNEARVSTSSTRTTTATSSNTGSATAEPAATSAAAKAVLDAAGLAKLKAAIGKESFEDTKVTLLKSALKNKQLSAEQLLELLSLYSFEENKIDIAKYCYKKLNDADEFYTVMEAFSFDASKEELNSWVETQ